MILISQSEVVLLGDIEKLAHVVEHILARRRFLTRISIDRYRNPAIDWLDSVALISISGYGIQVIAWLSK